MSGLSTGAYIVSPTAKMPNVVTNSVAARPGTCEATARISHDSTQMPPTTISSDGAERRAVQRTTAICSTMMTTQLTAAAVPIVRSETSRTVSA